MKNSFLILVAFVLFAFAGNAQKPNSYSQKTKKNNKAASMIQVCDLVECSSTWPVISSWINRAINKVEVLPKEITRADSALYESQLLESTHLGAIIYNCGGILIDDGWIRILGSGCNRLDRSVPAWNKGKSFTNFGDKASYILVADDVLGGLFAINKGGFEKTHLDTVYHYSPNTLMWTSTKLTYARFLVFCFSGDIKHFYSDFYWKGWQTDVKKLGGNEVISCFPLMWTRDKKDLMNCNRKVLPIQKQWILYNGETTSTASKSKKSSTTEKSKTP